nr:unnamed protein product [Spirometra erinaceieuropaei]
MLFNVVLERHPQVGLGLAVKGGNPGEWEGRGAHIVDILPGGPAFGKLRPGDIVLAINGISLEQKTYSEILATLRDVDNFATLLVYRRDEEPEVGTSCQSLFLPETPADMKREYRDPPTHLKSLSPRRTTSMPGFHDDDDPNVWAARRTHASFPVLPCEGMHNSCGSFYCNGGSGDDIAASETSEQRQRRANLLKVNLAKKRASEALGVELSGQLIITSIAPGGKAERSGLRVGDRVVNLNGIDAAHLSLIDAAYILRREQSDVTLMRVEHEDGEETLARLDNTESSPRVYENLRERAQPVCHHQHHTCCCHSFLAQGRQSVECVHTPTPMWQLRERPSAGHICTMSPCLEDSGSEDRGLISRSPRLHAADAVHCTQCHGGQTKIAPWMGDRSNPTGPFTSRPGRFARLADEVDTGAPAGPFGAHGRTPEVTVSMAGGTSAAAVGTTGSVEDGKDRVVTVSRHPLLGTGIRLIGGNAAGLFISDVNPQSSAAAAGVAPGDEILAINDEEVKNMTKADAALRILGTPVAVKLELRQNATKYAAFLNELLGPGDDFYVRAAFSLSPLTDVASYDDGDAEQVPPLPIACGDIFHVSDSLYNGSFSSWLAQRVSPNTSRLGRIPSSEKALKLLRDPLQNPLTATGDFSRDHRTKQGSAEAGRNAHLSQVFAETPDLIPSNPYLRVVKMERFPLPRPIVLYGPLSDRARQLLLETPTLERTENGSLDERLRFEIPPISGKPIEAGGWAEMSAGVIRMSAIQAIMERGSHPVVDLRPSSVEGLIQNGFPPIVLLFTASSVEQIKSILDKQQQQQSSETASVRRWKTTKEKSRHLWAEALSLRQTIPHLITDCVQLLNSFQDGELDETEWLNNLLSVIRYQQSQPIWVAEGSFVLRNLKTTVPMEQQAEPLVLQETDFNSSSKSDTGSRCETKQSLIWPYKEDSSAPDEVIADWNALEKIKLSALSVNPDVQLTYIESVRPSLLVDTQTTLLQRRGITVDEVSQTDPISSFVDGTCDKALMTFPTVPELKIPDKQDEDSDQSTVKGEEEEEHGEEDKGDSWFVFDDFPRSYGISRKPLSARNLPCGIISEPRAVVAETSGEFDHTGGKLVIPEHGVMLEIPPGALPEMTTKQTLYLRVYDGREGACGSDQASESGKPHIVSPLVMCGPKGLQFQKPVVLTLPRFHTHRRDRRGEEIRCWALSVMHAATLTDANSSSENETAPQATRKWHEARPADPWLAGERNLTTFRDTDIDSDSSAGVTCQIADTVISLLIYHF